MELIFLQQTFCTTLWYLPKFHISLKQKEEISAHLQEIVLEHSNRIKKSRHLEGHIVPHKNIQGNTLFLHRRGHSTKWTFLQAEKNSTNIKKFWNRLSSIMKKKPKNLISITNSNNNINNHHKQYALTWKRQCCWLVYIAF